MLSNLQEIYQERKDRFSVSAAALEAKYNRFSFVRLACFALGLALVAFLFTIIEAWAFIVLAVLLFAFSKLVNWHSQLVVEKDHMESLVKINSNELSSLNNDHSVFKSGKEFQTAAHPYAIDLDIFGEHSFYQYCNRTTTATGSERLAEYLQELTTIEEIKMRHEAIKELKDRLEFRQHFQAFGLSTEDSPKHLNSLKNWLKEPPFMINNKVYQIALYIVPIFSFLGAYLWLFHLPWFLALLFFLPAGFMLKKTLEQVNVTHLQTTHAEKTLAFYSRLIAHIEQEEFTSKKLHGLRNVFVKNDQKASVRLSRLSYIIKQLNVRYNAFVLLINIFGLWDLHWVLKLEKWKASQKEDLPVWFDTLAELEAVLSLATLFYNNPDWTFPTISEHPLVDGIALGHPLIPREGRVANDTHIPTGGHIKLVTGSNMAGKSTFLRTVGLNIVLAMSGSPVCAEKLTLPIIQVYTSMRTQDALHESTSSFYAELKRLKMIIEAVEGRTNAFFLLDEILKGTNSTDRHTGSKALIHQLINSQGSGIIATHDLELGELEATSNGSVENLCIEVEVNGEELTFDYTVKKGVSKSFNATQLMRNMGIKV